MLALPLRGVPGAARSEEHTSELQSRRDLVCRLLLEKKKKLKTRPSVRLITTTDASQLTYHRELILSCAIICTFFYFFLLVYYLFLLFFFFFNDTATTEIYTLSLHDALPIFPAQPAASPPIMASHNRPRG